MKKISSLGAKLLTAIITLLAAIAIIVIVLTGIASFLITIPVLLVIAALVLIGVSIWYFVEIARNRHKGKRTH